VPDRGLLERTAIEASALAGAHPAPWTLPGARFAQLTYEVSQQAALGRMPADVNRPVPCYARLFVLDAPESPAGPFRLAALLTGGRYRMLPKNVLTDGIVDGPAGAVQGAFGSPYRPGRVELTRDGARLVATVADAGGELARLTLPALYAVDPGMLRWDAWLGFSSEGETLQIVEYSAQPDAREAFLSKGATLETSPALQRNHLWRTYRNLNTVTACYVEGTVTLTSPEVQQVVV
jgi:hypothetical protein